MKKLIKYGCYTLLAVAVFVVTLLIVGFCLMDFNPVNWQENERLAFIMIWVISTGFIAGFPREL